MATLQFDSSAKPKISSNFLGLDARPATAKTYFVSDIIRRRCRRSYVEFFARGTTRSGADASVSISSMLNRRREIKRRNFDTISPQLRRSLFRIVGYVSRALLITVRVSIVTNCFTSLSQEIRLFIIEDD